MGFYFGAEQERGPAEDCSPTFTAREYASQFSGALATCAQHPTRGCLRCARALRHLAAGQPAAAVLVLGGALQQYPQDEHLHRLLGTAHLACGSLRPALKHLEIALSLLRRKAARTVDLRAGLRLHCDAAVIRLMLLGLHTKLDQAPAARFLMLEGLEGL